MFFGRAPGRAVLAFLVWLICAIPSTLAADSSGSRSVTVHIWPLDAPSPTPYLDVRYDATSMEAAVSKVYPVRSPSKKKGAVDDGDSLVRIGLWDVATRSWRGILTGASALTEPRSRKISLHVDGQGSVWHVDMSGPGAARTQGNVDDTSNSEIQVELARPRPAPAPVLNEPLVLDDRGKMPEKELEKSFLQRSVPPERSFCLQVVPDRAARRYVEGHASNNRQVLVDLLGGCCSCIGRSWRQIVVEDRWYGIGSQPAMVIRERQAQRIREATSLQSDLDQQTWHALL